MKPANRTAGIAAAFAAALVLAGGLLHAQDVVRIGFALPLTGGQSS